MRTRVFNIIIVMMVIAATVALVRSMLTIQAFPDVTIVSHQLMPTIPTAYLPMRTIALNIIIVMMVMAATVALVRSMLMILAFAVNVLVVLPHGFMYLLSQISHHLSGRRLLLLHTFTNRSIKKQDIIATGVLRRNCASSKNSLLRLLFPSIYNKISCRHLTLHTKLLSLMVVTTVILQYVHPMVLIGIVYQLSVATTFTFRMKQILIVDSRSPVLITRYPSFACLANSHLSYIVKCQRRKLCVLSRNVRR